jgi:hypothetical protein
VQQSQATIHTTSCSRYVIVAPECGIDHQVCRSLREAYDVLRGKRITTAEMAQRVVFDEMIGQPADETVTYSLINIPAH